MEPGLHHARSLEWVVHGEVKGATRSGDPDFQKAYAWLREQVGYDPVFLSVGQGDDALINTGYLSNFESPKPRSPHILFSYHDVPGTYADVHAWCAIIPKLESGLSVDDEDIERLFRPGRSAVDWHATAKDGEQVQLLAPSLYLPKADRIRAPSVDAKDALERLGFSGVEVYVLDPSVAQ
ncbi:MAG: hypothetical protein ABIH41_00010 [Nanoarchaeota archaeon]